MDNALRESNIEAVFSQLREISRRTSARSRSLEKSLTFVEHSLLQFIARTDNARATDIAAAFSLNRSTVSRQINTLIELGLVHYLGHPSEPDSAAPARGRVLALTESGHTQLAASTRVHQGVVEDRLAAWSDAEIAAFAASLSRYNEAD